MTERKQEVKPQINNKLDFQLRKGIVRNKGS